MRVVLQRVASASVSVGGSVTASIGRGVVCLVGLGRDDTIADDGAWCARKLLVRGISCAPCFPTCWPCPGYAMLAVNVAVT